MPRRISLGAATGRATRTFHADWWSDAKDPVTGQYLERLVLYPFLNQREIEALKNEELSAQMALLESGLDEQDMQAAMALIPDDVHSVEELQGADRERLSTSSAMKAMMANPKLAKAMTRLQADASPERRKMLYRIHEMTERVREEGDGPECFVPMALRDTAGRLLPGAEEVLADLEGPDYAFVVEAVASLGAQEQRAIVPPTPDDVLAAARTADKMRLGMPGVDPALATAEGAAQDSFRPDC